MVEWLAVPTLDREVPGSNPARDRVLMTVWHFIAKTFHYHPSIAFRKHAYSNILEISPPKNWKFSDKNSCNIIFLLKNIDCGYPLELPQWGSSNEFTQSMFLSRNKKNNVYPCKPQFYYKWGLRGSKLYRYVFLMSWYDFSNVERHVKHQTIIIICLFLL